MTTRRELVDRLNELGVSVLVAVSAAEARHDEHLYFALRDIRENVDTMPVSMELLRERVAAEPWPLVKRSRR